MNSIKKLLKKDKDGKNDPTAAIMKMREMEDMFNKKQEYLEFKIQQELEVAKANGRSNRRLALQALRRKKRHEQQLQQIDGTLTTLEMQREALESASTNTSILSTMKKAADALKSAHQKLKVDDVHDIIDDIAEQQTVAKEIADAISTKWAYVDDVDEDDLLRELDEMEQKELDRALLETVPTAELPSVPVTPIPGGSSRAAENSNDLEPEEADQLKKLMNWAD